MALIKIFENDDFVVDYDKDKGRYRVSYFEDCHFKEECWFDEYKEEEKSLQKVLNNARPFSHEEIKLALGETETVDDDVIGRTIKWMTDGQRLYDPIWDMYVDEFEDEEI